MVAQQALTGCQSLPASLWSAGGEVIATTAISAASRALTLLSGTFPGVGLKEPALGI